MKKQLLYLFLTLFASFPSYGQAGTLDSTFGVNGMASYYQQGTQLNKYALQQDGKIIAAGQLVNTTNTISQDFCAVRFNTDGSIDSTFGTNGVAIMSISGSSEYANAVAVQPDDKIVLGGYSEDDSTSNIYFTVARFTANGTIDSSFADNGVKIIGFLGLWAEVRCMGIQTDSSKIVLGGLSHTSPNPSPIVIRLNENGSYDSAFANNGVYIASNTNNWFRYPADLKLQPDNKIVLASSVMNALGVVRLNEDGTLDNSFGTGGYNVSNFSGASVAIDIQPDGKILELGYASSGGPNTYIKIVRYDANGTIDNNFGNGGQVVSAINNYATGGSDIKVQPSDDKIIVVGGIASPPPLFLQSKFLIMRFNADGSPDTEFGTQSGYTATQFDNSTQDYGVKAFILNDGKILVGGSTQILTNEISSSMARYNSCQISVTGDPMDQTIHAGATANFTVSSTSASANYQWQTLMSNWENINDGGQYSGTQTHTLHIANITAANDQQQFRSIAISGVCSDTSGAATLTVDTTNGIDEITKQAGIHVFPNPVENQINIRFKNPDYNRGILKITDAIGKIKRTVKLNGVVQLSIDTGKWPSGIYLLQVIPEKGIPVTFRVVKK